MTSTIRTEVVALTHDGRGLSYMDGKVVFIEGGLPGESVSFAYVRNRRDYAEGKLVQIESPSPKRVEPECSHFGVCGGCSLQHLAANEQIVIKQGILLEQLHRIGKLSPPQIWEPIVGPYWNYRYKARLGVKFVAKKNKVVVGFREKGSAFVADLQECRILALCIGSNLVHLAELVRSLSIYRQVPQIELAIDDQRCALVLRVLQDLTAADRINLRSFAISYGYDIYVQRRGPESIEAVYPETPALLGYFLPSHNLVIQFGPLEFTQINPVINRKMIDRVISLLKIESDDRVLDLFCGVGNFSLPIARYAKKVVGVEVSRTAVERAKHNAFINEMTNLEFHAADLTQSVDGSTWCNQTYDKALLDPSRAGASEILPILPKLGIAHLVYVSCNPATFARDASILVNQLGYRLVAVGVMDMFPHTSHVESISLFQK